MRVLWTDHVSTLGGDLSSNTLEISGMHVNSWDRHTLRLGGRFQTTFNLVPGELGGFSLGGFLNGSGLARDQFDGNHVALAQAIYYYRLNDENPFFDLPIYVGGSIEAGSVYDDIDDFTLGSLGFAGSAFVGMDSPLGPAYLGFGITEEGDSAFYFFVGQTF